MNAVKRVLVGIVMMALTFGVAAVPLLTTAGAANAEPADPAACASAQSSVAKQKKAVATANKAVAKAKKQLKKAKKAKVKKAKKAKLVKKAKRNLKAKQKALRTKRSSLSRAEKSRASACADRPVDNETAGLGQLLALLTKLSGSGVGGAEGTPIDKSQLQGVVNLLGGGASVPVLSNAQLTDLLAGFNSSDLDPAVLSELLGGLLSADQITALLGGLGDPAALTALFTEVLGQFAALAGSSFPMPTDPAAFLELFATGLDALTGLLDPAQVGALLSLLATAAGSGGDAFDAQQLFALMSSLVPAEILEAFDSEALADLLAGFNAISADPTALLSLLGGQFTPQQITALLGGSASPEVLAQLISQVVAQLSSLGGGDFFLPGAVDPSVITNLVTAVVDLVESILDGIFGNLPQLPICILPIPILCT
ncbi:hypothetical protein NODU109028_00510 [Nocardioides dubius]|uniref:Uncharacterized protein n=1 Tax=Nocardioides dubius TaxID=317019 RepID=A0ABN1U016_9ACTN